jgi:crescentin
MRKVSDFLTRKSVTSTSETLPLQNRPENGGNPTFADIGARIGEENEALRNLLIDTGHQFSAVDELKETFGKLIGPLNKMLRTLEEEKSDNVSLRAALAELRASHEALRNEFQELGKKTATSESENERLRRELEFAEQAARELESNKSELSSELATVRVVRANLESELGDGTSRNNALSEENRILLEHANSADKRIVELEAEAALARENLSLLEDEKSSLRTALIRRSRRTRACLTDSARAGMP